MGTDGDVVDVGAALPSLVAEAAEDDVRHARDPETFWASYIGFCPRQAYVMKLGLRDASDVQGRLAAGRLVQDHIASLVTDHFPHLETDARAVYDDGDVRVVGRPTCYDPATETVYHVKTRNGWYNFTPPVERHRDQLHVYMAGLDAARGQVVYVSLNDLADIRVWPPEDSDDAFETPSESRLDAVLEKARSIRADIVANGIATAPNEVPFEPCGCYFCEDETLDFPEVEAPSPSPTPGDANSSKMAVASTDGGGQTHAPSIESVDTREVSTDGVHIPEGLRERDIWVVWDCREKVARAPWQTGTMYPCEWAKAKDVDPRQSFEKAKIVAGMPVTQIHEEWPFPNGDDLPDEVNPAVLLPHERGDDPVAFIDFDDVRDSETGEASHEAWAWLDRFGGYAEVSRSGTGFHVYVQASLPDDTGAFAASLDGPGTVEVYDGARFTGGTWRHVAGTPRDRVPAAQEDVAALLARYGAG